MQGLAPDERVALVPLGHWDRIGRGNGRACMHAKA
jgi:hypothetical protein